MKDRRIRYTIVASPLGRLLIAASDRGVCHVRFGEDAARLAHEAAGEFPFAPLERDDAGLAGWAAAVVDCASGRPPRAPVPLDVAGSRFQRRVWAALEAIPCGQTRSYSTVAAALGRPRAARAVARACATNPVPLLVPCHRVVRRDGGLGGYRYGLARKRELLRRESGAQQVAVSDDGARRRAARRPAAMRVSQARARPVVVT